MWALILENRVTEITEIDPIDRFHASFTWVPCGEDTEVGMVYSEGLFKKQQTLWTAEEERQWRNSELARADYELNKVQDSDVKSVGTVTEWRNYRKALREWPQSEHFPDIKKRPLTPH